MFSVYAPLLLTAALTSPEFDELNLSYFRLHETWRLSRLPPEDEHLPYDVYFVFDPRHGAMWIERDGKFRPDEVRRLPSGLKWNAYHVTPDGILELTFPIRLKQQGNRSQNNGYREQIHVLGKSATHQWHFDIGAGHFNPMGGRTSFQVRGRHPTAWPEKRADNWIHRSILVDQSPDGRRLPRVAIDGLELQMVDAGSD